jgi:hypothetical protein
MASGFLADAVAGPVWAAWGALAWPALVATETISDKAIADRIQEM